jgi:hypothetical protein
MEFLKTMHGARCPVDNVPKAKAAVSCGLEALILAQSDLPTAGALNLMIKWERLWWKERQMPFCVVPVSWRIVSYLVLFVALDSIRFDCFLLFVYCLRFRHAYSMFCLYRKEMK